MCGYCLLCFYHRWLDSSLVLILHNLYINILGHSGALLFVVSGIILCATRVTHQPMRRPGARKHVRQYTKYVPTPVKKPTKRFPNRVLERHWAPQEARTGRCPALEPKSLINGASFFAMVMPRWSQNGWRFLGIIWGSSGDGLTCF